jgi:hypothetical protein
VSTLREVAASGIASGRVLKESKTVSRSSPRLTQTIGLQKYVERLILLA